MADREPLPEPDDGAGRGPLPRWAWIAGGVAVALLVVAVAIVVTHDSGDDTATTASNRSTTTTAGSPTNPGVNATSTTEIDKAGAAKPDGDPANGPMASIPVGSVPPGALPAVCAETVARLKIYRSVAAANGATLAGDLFNSMTEFEAEITTNAKNEEWGDFLVEKLTAVRREWSNARSALDSGDTASAKTHADAALAQLDTAIGGVNCT